MKHSKLKAPSKSGRNCNGGYSKKKPVKEETFVHRKFNLRDQHGNLKQR